METPFIFVNFNDGLPKSADLILEYMGYSSLGLLGRKMMRDTGTYDTTKTDLNNVSTSGKIDLSTNPFGQTLMDFWTKGMKGSTLADALTKSPAFKEKVKQFFPENTPSEIAEMVQASVLKEKCPVRYVPSWVIP